MKSKSCESEARSEITVVSCLLIHNLLKHKLVVIILDIINLLLMVCFVLVNQCTEALYLQHPVDNK